MEVDGRSFCSLIPYFCCSCTEMMDRCSLPLLLAQAAALCVLLLASSASAQNVGSFTSLTGCPDKV